MTLPHIAAILKGLPEKPGVYIMRDEEGTVLYVGKAIKLRRRVSSYFRHSGFASPRLRKLVSLVRDISVIRTESKARVGIVRGLDDLNRTVDEIDPTIYGFEEKIGEIEVSR